MKTKHSLPLPVLLVLVVVGCAGVAERRPPPAWIQQPPVSTDRDALIIGYGTGTGRNDAREAADGDIADQLARILLDRFDPDATGVADNIANAIDEIARERAGTISPEDTYTVTRPDGTREAYLFVRYSEALIAEDIAALSAPVERDDEPEHDEPDLPEEPVREDPLLEVRRLVQDVLPTGTERIRTLEEALSVASRIVLTAVPGEIQTPLGFPLQQYVTVGLAVQEDDRIGNSVVLSVVETGPEVDGTRGRRRGTLTLESGGTAHYMPRVPELSGVTRITFQPAWLEDSLEPWRRNAQTSETETLLNALEARLTVEVMLRVSSLADRIPTAVVLIDRDIAGNPIAGRDAARGAIQQFNDQGFQVMTVNLSAAAEMALADRDSPTVADLYDLLPFEVLSSVERVVVGTAGIVQFSENDGITVVINVDARAFDLRRDQLLAEISLEERVTGRDARATLRSAFQAAGRRTARRMVPRLP